MTTQPRCTLTATLHARPEKRAELIKLLESFVPRSRAEPGCIEYHFHVSDEDANVFYFYENWTDRRRSTSISTFPTRRNGSAGTTSSSAGRSNSATSRC